MFPSFPRCARFLTWHNTAMGAGLDLHRKAGKGDAPVTVICSTSASHGRASFVTSQPLQPGAEAYDLGQVYAPRTARYHARAGHPWLRVTCSFPAGLGEIGAAC